MKITAEAHKRAQKTNNPSAKICAPSVPSAVKTRLSKPFCAPAAPSAVHSGSTTEEHRTPQKTNNPSAKICAPSVPSAVKTRLSKPFCAPSAPSAVHSGSTAEEHRTPQKTNNPSAKICAPPAPSAVNTRLSKLKPSLVLAAILTIQSIATAQTPDSIGIFNLKEIRSTPLDPEILSKTKEGDVNVEKVRYTSLPGVRVVMTLTYKDGAKGAPGYQFVENFPIRTLTDEAKSGFVGIFISPPTGNKDPKKIESVGGPVYPTPFNFNTQFLPDKNNSYIYQYTVAMLRGFDYLATRPEINLSNTTVTGYAWAATMICLLHAIDDRPAAYIVFHAPGYHVDEQGLSAGKPFLLYNDGTTPVYLTRKLYEMYCPAAYAQYGTKPIYVGSALDDAYTKVDAMVEYYHHLKSPKVFAFAPNRHQAPTGRNELNSFVSWMSAWVFSGEKPSTIGEGAFKAADGKVTYTCSVDSKYPLTHADLLVSYGRPGNWLGRTWHRFPMTQQGAECSGQIPIYDPHTPFYVIAQVETAKFGAVANCPQYVNPEAEGITQANAEYPATLFDPSQKDDLYFRLGSIEWSADGPGGQGSAIVIPGSGSVIMFQNVDAMLWKGKKTLSIWLKGDGGPGPIRCYLEHDPNYYLELDRKNFSIVDLISTGSNFTAGWNEYSIPLTKIPNLEQVSCLIFDSQKRKLQIGPIILK